MSYPVELARTAVGLHLKRKVERLWRSEDRPSKPHGLKAPLIVSLTSFPARYDTLPLTIKCLLTQTVRPDKVILWLGEKDVSAVTSELHDLEAHGLEIRLCTDYRQYNKIIPTLKEFPDVFIVTADDDLYYWQTWLEDLVGEHVNGVAEVICHRAHKLVLGEDGMPLLYREWLHNTGDTAPSHLIFPTGVGGVLYKPGTFGPEVLDHEAFLELSPSADDIWLYFMAGLNGSTYRKVGPKHTVVPWPGSQKISLRALNVPVGGGNDTQMSKMVGRYGFPFWTSAS